MPQDGISAENLTIKQVLKDFYEVPSYQREYVWQTSSGKSTKGKQVDQFLEDINSSLVGDADRSYFIGSFVVGRQDGEGYEVIDGQQRITTILVLLCAIKNQLERKLHVRVWKTLNDNIRYPKGGSEEEQPRLGLHYDEGADLLDRFETGKELPQNGKHSSPTQINLTSAFRECVDFLDRNFDTEEDLKGFYNHLMDDVYVVRITTPNATKALQIFETINARGTSLDAMDLLKNLLFQKLPRTEYSDLTLVWNKLSDTLNRAREKPLRFLRYFVMANYATEPVREETLYSWFKEHKGTYEANPKKFVNEMWLAAQDYVSFVEGKARGGVEDQHLRNVAELTPSSRQHIILLLAARNLQPQLFSKLCFEIECTLFCLAMVREPARVLEPKFNTWAQELRGVASKDDLEVFLDNSLREERRKLASRVFAALRDVPSAKIGDKRVKYILARLADYVDEAVTPSAKKHHSRMQSYLSADLEHILPQKPSEPALDEFGRDVEWRDYVRRLGNMTLTLGTLNQAMGNVPFTTKQGFYKADSIMLTRFLEPSGIDTVGKDTKLSKLIARMKIPATWNPQAIKEREDFLIGLAAEVWSIPTTDHQ